MPNNLSIAPLDFETLPQYQGLTHFQKMHHTGGVSITIVIATVTMYVEGLNVISYPKCNKVLNVITFCPKYNNILS